MKKSRKQIQREGQIYQITTLVAGSFSLPEVLDKLAEAAVRMVGVKACSIRLLDEKAGELEMRSTFGLSEEYRNKGVVSKNDTVIKAAFAGEAVVLDDMRVDGRVKYRQATIKEGLVSQLTVAMNFKGHPIGVLRLYSPKTKRFNDNDIALARSVASQCAVAITNARLYAEAIQGARIAEQMRLAGVVQRRMIPEHPPKISGFDIAASYIPCFDIGGDFYDFLPINDSSFAVVIADVIGKGIPAAIMMSLFRGAVLAYTDSRSASDNIGGIIAKLNRMACSQCRDGEFVTLFYAVFDSKKHTVTYCSCGHEPMILLRDGEIGELQKGGLVLGVDPDAHYEFETIQVKEADTFLLYTDGLIDASNYDNEFWGRKNLFETAKKFSAGTAYCMLRNILTYRRRFVGLANQIDDTSLIAIRAESKPDNG